MLLYSGINKQQVSVWSTVLESTAKTDAFHFINSHIAVQYTEMIHI